jgi:hypothetical protein
MAALYRRGGGGDIATCWCTEGRNPCQSKRPGQGRPCPILDGEDREWTLSRLIASINTQINRGLAEALVWAVACGGIKRSSPLREVQQRW